MNKTCAIVVTYNRKEKLRVCLEALFRSSERADILVVDNASTDDTALFLAPFAERGEILYCNPGKNLGGAGGFQYGIRCAMEKGYDAFWMMDDDCYPEKEALAKLKSAERELNGNFGFLSSMALWRDGSVCRMNHQKIGLKKKVEDFSSARTPVIMASFVSLYFTRSTVEKFGLPIKEFFIWADDLEYTRRLSRALPCYLVPSSRVLHDMESNEKVNIASEEKSRLWRYAYLYRNEVYVYRREGIRGWMYLLLRMALHSAKILLQAKENKREKFFTIWKSFFEGVHFHPEIEYFAEEKQ